MFQNVSSESWLWLLGALVGMVTLLQLMHNRERQLHEMLQEVVRQKLEWAKKKAKAAHMARVAAKHIAEEEAALKRQLAEAAKAEEEAGEKEDANDPFAPVLFD